MHCSSCGYSLPAGAVFCTNCGAKVYDQGNPGSQPSGSSPMEPTIPVSSPYGANPITPSFNQQAVPPTVYGAPYSTPQQYSYEAPPPPPPANVYGAPPPSNPYGAPYVSPPGSFVPPSQPPTPRKGPRVGLIIGIVVLLLLVVVGAVLAFNAVKGGSQTNTPTATTASSTPTAIPTPIVTPTLGGTSPSGAQIDPTAATIVTKAQTASAIDSNYSPTQLTSNFNVGQAVYVTFNLTLNGQSGYVEVKFYANSTDARNKILTVQPAFDHGYFTLTYNQATTGTAELYWCTQSDCSDAKLATFVTFNVA